MNTSHAQTAEERAIARLAESELFQTYRSAFHLATGLKLSLCLPGDEEEPAAFFCGEQNRFCSLINQAGGCTPCLQAHQELAQNAANHPASIRCFAGMKESAVPIWAGNRVAAYIRFGQVLTARPSEEQLEGVMAELAACFPPEVLKDLHAAYLNAEVVDSKRYFGCVTLVCAFALQLADELNRLLTAEENIDPPAIVKAKQYINARLEESINLADVATYAGLSSYYFCKLFKQTLGMTLTEYVNRRRVEWAKRKLANPRHRITEIAFDVGYQSLSQFNRSFLRYAGESPTQYRDRVRAKESLAGTS